MNKTQKPSALSPRQAAQSLGTSLYFVYAELWAGRFPGAEKIGRTWRIPPTAIADRLKAREARNG